MDSALKHPQVEAFFTGQRCQKALCTFRKCRLTEGLGSFQCALKRIVGISLSLAFYPLSEEFTVSCPVSQQGPKAVRVHLFLSEILCAKCTKLIISGALFQRQTPD